MFYNITRLMKVFSNPYLLILLLNFLVLFASAQNVSFNENGTEPDSSAMLDISARDKGILIPRMTSAERLAIVNPANSLFVYQTDGNEGIYVYNAVSNIWQRLSYDSNNDLATVLSRGNDANGDSIVNLELLGIGMNDPLNPLEVRGPASFVDDGLNSVGRPTGSHVTIFPRSGSNNIESANGTTPTRLTYHAGTHSFTTGITNLGDQGLSMQISNNGNVGIKEPNPSAELDVNGSIHLSGEVNHDSTGTFNLLPIAMARIDALGNVRSGTPNISCIRTGVGEYEITVSGHSANINQDIVTATLIGGGTGTITLNSFLGNYLINTYTPTLLVLNTAADRDFSIIIYAD